MNIQNQIEIIANKYAAQLKKMLEQRTLDMEADDNSHYLIYQVLGISTPEGQLIDLYQNKGRLLYKYAGSFLENITILCFQSAFPGALPKQKITNTLGSKPKTFEIDCLVENDALEIKWRDATTDGDHITKERTRIKVIQAAGYKPVRIMFYYPNRLQAIRIQETLKTVYAGVQGEYYWGDTAWDYVKQRTNIDLKDILMAIARKNTESLQIDKA